MLQVTKITVTGCEVKFESDKELKALRKKISEEYAVTMAEICFDIVEVPD